MTAKLCEEKTRLLVLYQKAAKAYAEAVSQLVAKVDVVKSKAAYERLNRAAEQARHASKDARGRLQRHTADHGC